MAAIEFDTTRQKGALAALFGGIALACAVLGTQPPERLLDSSRVRSAANRAMVDLDRRMICWKGKTPQFDGRISEGEYEDASPFRWNADWSRP